MNQLRREIKNLNNEITQINEEKSELRYKVENLGFIIKEKDVQIDQQKEEIK